MSGTNKRIVVKQPYGLPLGPNRGDSMIKLMADEHARELGHA